MIHLLHKLVLKITCVCPSSEQICASQANRQLACVPGPGSFDFEPGLSVTDSIPSDATAKALAS